MQFDLRAVDPPALDLSWVLLLGLVAACTVGLSWTGLTIMASRSTAADWRVWRRGFLAGVLVSALVPAMQRAEEPSYYPALFGLWVLLSLIGAGIVLARSQSADRRKMGRWIVQGVSVFALGVPVPAVLGAIINAARE
jgi:hypothetical protein